MKLQTNLHHSTFLPPGLSLSTPAQSFTHFSLSPLFRLNINSNDRNSILMLRWEKFQMKICNLLALKVLFLAVKMFRTFSNQKFSHHFLALNFFHPLPSRSTATEKAIIQRSGLTFFTRIQIESKFSPLTIFFRLPLTF
jgi:hypothetical protein